MPTISSSNTAWGHTDQFAKQITNQPLSQAACAILPGITGTTKTPHAATSKDAYVKNEPIYSELLILYLGEVTKYGHHYGDPPQTIPPAPVVMSSPVPYNSYTNLPMPVLTLQKLTGAKEDSLWHNSPRKLLHCSSLGRDHQCTWPSSYHQIYVPYGCKPHGPWLWSSALGWCWRDAFSTYSLCSHVWPHSVITTRRHWALIE